MPNIERFGIQLEKNNYQEASIYGLACAYSLVEKKITDYLRPFGLTPAKFNAMMIIKHIGKEKGLSQIEIGRRLIVTASNMTRLLDNLEKQGYIERFSRKGDRRVKLIKISRKGSDILDKVWPGYYEKISGIANLLDKADQKYVAHIIGKWCDRLGGKNNA
jgi:DNA-binding MarR family transcriptional regulator